MDEHEFQTSRRTVVKGVLAGAAATLAAPAINAAQNSAQNPSAPFWTALQVSGGQTMRKVKNFGADTPIKRPGQPVEIAPVYVQLAAADSTYVTGQVYGASEEGAYHNVSEKCLPCGSTLN